MKIFNINQSILYETNPTFKSTTSFHKTDLGQEIGSNSWMFREDIDWLEAAEFDLELFKDKDKVKIVQFASSDGSESYTKIISLLLKQREKEAQKFFPIEAYDINSEVVKAANSGMINFIDNDFKRAEALQVNLKEFFTEAPTTLSIKNDNMYHFFNIPTTTYKVSDKLRNKVNFYNKDMFEVLRDMKDGETPIILCRNIFSYFDDIDTRRAIRILGEKIMDNGLLYLGKRDFDNSSLSMWLKESGFTPVTYTKNGEIMTLRNVFKKTLKR